MIYVKTEYDSMCESTHIRTVYEINNKDIESDYKNFINQKAKELNAVINVHWLCLCLWQPHHQHLTKTEYNRLSRQWKKFLKENTIDKFILDNGGKILEFKTI